MTASGKTDSPAIDKIGVSVLEKISSKLLQLPRCLGWAWEARFEAVQQNGIENQGRLVSLQNLKIGNIEFRYI